jgi:uncharacterized surface protein with fasciclin (FAS1) repeats
MRNIPFIFMISKEFELFLIIGLFAAICIIDVEGQSDFRETLLLSNQMPNVASLPYRIVEPVQIWGNNPPGPASESMSILGYLNRNEYSIFDKLISFARLDNLLSNGQFTVLAPSNEAFDSLPKGDLEEILENETILVSILQYLILPGSFDEIDPNAAYTLSGKEINLTFFIMQYGNQQVVQLSNGNVIPVSSVLRPDSLY